MRKSLAIPKHIDWYLEDFIRLNVHQDAAVLNVGSSDGSLLLRIKQILKGKGLKECRKAGAPTLETDPDFKLFFENDSFDVVILSWVLSRPNAGALRILQHAARVSRKFVLVQCINNSGWTNLLSSLGAIEQERILPQNTADDLERRFFVVDVASAPANYEPHKPPVAPSILDSEPPPSAEKIASLPTKVLTQAEKDRMLAKFGDSPAAIAVIKNQPVADPSSSVVHFLNAEHVLTQEEEDSGYTTSGWYFINETRSEVYGPYDTVELANKKLGEYCESLLAADADAAIAADEAYGAPGQPLEERTLLIVKPDAFNRKEEIKKLVEARGLRVSRECVSFMFSRDWAELLYSEHAGKPFFEEHVSFMCSGECATYEVEGVNAVAALRELAGATDPAKADPLSLRGLFGGTELPRNAVHTSDSVASAKRELSYFFPGDCCMTKEQKEEARKKDLESFSEQELSSLALAVGVEQKDPEESTVHFMDRVDKSLETISAEDVGPMPKELLEGL